MIGCTTHLLEVNPSRSTELSALSSIGPVLPKGRAEVTRSIKICPRHGNGGCSCGMGNLFRFVEPLILLELSKTPGASGYDLLHRLEGHTLTGTTIDKAAVYRCLGVLERNGMTSVEWLESARGAGRKAYTLTQKGIGHLAEWADLLELIAGGLRGFVEEARSPRTRRKQ